MENWEQTCLFSKMVIITAVAQNMHKADSSSKQDGTDRGLGWTSWAPPDRFDTRDSWNQPRHNNSIIKQTYSYLKTIKFHKYIQDI